MKIPDKNHQDTKEALLNEEKGNIFEFLVAQSLSRLNHTEADFFLELNLDLKNTIASYEESVRQTHEELLPQLAILASKTAIDLYSHLQKEKIYFTNIYLIGKISANFEQEEWHESDLVLKTKEGTLLPISLKLAKENSYTNTKSAGAKSFIEKYFHAFSESEALQKELNKEIDQAFTQMAHRLYQMASLPFTGKFDDNWKTSWSELPGELPNEYREVIFINYARVAGLIYRQLNFFLNKDRQKFVSMLAPLCGMGDRKLIQVSCYHQQHSLKSIEIKKFVDFFYPEIEISLGPLRENMSSFDITLGKIILQIRVKPMNKFTTPSYKINCSIKHMKEN